MTKKGYPRRPKAPEWKAELMERILMSGEIPGHLERVLLRLIWIADDSGLVWVKEADLARSLNISDRQVRRAITELKVYGVDYHRPIKPQWRESGCFRVRAGTVHQACGRSTYLERDLSNRNSAFYSRLYGDRMQEQMGD